MDRSLRCIPPSDGGMQMSKRRRFSGELKRRSPWRRFGVIGRFKRSPRGTRSIRTRWGRGSARRSRVWPSCSRRAPSAGPGTMRVRFAIFTPRSGVDRREGFFVARVRSMSRAERRAMVVHDHPALSLSRQCRRLSIGRS